MSGCSSMKSSFSRARLSVLSVALCGVFSAYGQTDVKGTLGEVVVTASRFAEPADALPYGVSVITAKEIESSGASSVSEAIMKVLGVQGRLDTSGANSYGLDLRGFGQTADSNQVVIVDGHRLNEQDFSGAALGSIPIDQVQRIEVLHGSGAVLYGEGATAGVILITTKAGIGAERNNSAVLSATAGSFGLREERVGATVVAGGFSLDASATDRKTNGNRDNFASDNNNVGATAQWSNDWLRLGVQSSRSMTHSGLPGGLTQALYDANPQQAFTPADYGQIKNETSGAFLEASVGDWQLGLDLGQRTSKTDTLYAASNSTTSSAIDASTTNLRARHSFIGNGLANSLTLGFDNEDWKSVTSYSPHNTSASNGVYVNDDLSLLATGTRLSVGLRSEDITKSSLGATGIDSVQTAWTLGLTQDIAPGAQLFARTGQSFRLANVDEIGFVTPGTTLQPQSSRDVELGARLHFATGRVELRWYQSAISNEIAYDGNAIGPSSIYGFNGANVNLDPTMHRGVELESHHNLTDKLALRLNLAARQAQFVSGPYAGNSIALVPGQTAALGLEIKPSEGHVVNLGVNWVSSQYADFSNQCNMPAYSTVDARYAYTLKSLELALGVTNLGDAKYYTQAYSCKAGVLQSIYPEAGRAVNASVKFKF